LPRPRRRCETTVIVVDAGVLVTALADDGPDGALCRSRLTGQALAAPHLIDLEVGSALRRLVRDDDVPERRARLALTDLAELPLERAPSVPLLPRCWELRENVTFYDAAYVALAELLDVPLLTADQRLARASGPRCTIDVLTAG
jgi:predicted nucleic acid-binding protein